MQNHKCRFCTQKNYCLYACAQEISKSRNLIDIVNKSLYYKHGQSQNYFYSRPVNQILKRDKHTIFVRVEDYNILDTQEEFLKQYYPMPNCQLQHKQLIRYYKFSIDHPMLYFRELKSIIQKYIARRSQVEYDWAMNQIEKEAQKDGHQKQRKQKKKSQPETSCFLKDLSESQRSMTIIKLLKNVEPDHTVERDWQKQFTQSLVEQDLTKALQFSTFIQQMELQRQNLISQQKTIYLGNIKKSLNLQLSTPVKSFTHTGFSNNTNNPSTSSNKRNLHFFQNSNNITTSNNITSTSNSIASQNFIMKTSIVNNPSFKPQSTMKIQPLRIIEVPKLKIKLAHQEPKSERKYDKPNQRRIDCLTQRIKTQLDEPHSTRSSVNMKAIIVKRRQNHQN